LIKSERGGERVRESERERVRESERVRDDAALHHCHLLAGWGFRVSGLAFGVQGSGSGVEG